MNNFKSSYLLFIRNLKKNFRMPMWVVMGLLQPMLYIIFYMPLLEKTGGGFTNSSADVIRMFVPGMLVTMGMGGFFSGFGFIDEMRQGIVARWLVSPISKMGIMISIVCNHLVTGLLQALILVVLARFFGLDAPLLGILLTIILILLLAATTVAISHTISIYVKEEHILAATTQTAYLPLMLLSGVMLPLSLAPEWMKKIALFNPFYYTVEAARSLFAADYDNPIILKGFGIMVISTMLFLALAVRALKKMVS
jgi:ABC-2 type transport system permease protein